MNDLPIPELSSIFDLYQRVMQAELLEYLQKQSQLRVRRGIYAVRVVLWLMIVQQLRPKGTLASTVEELAQGAGSSLLPDCKRVREGRISLCTGGYCQARKKLPKRLVQQVNNEVVEQLRSQIGEPFAGLERSVFLLDGSSVQLEHSAELLQNYPPTSNRHGRSHWPVVRILVLHDVGSGLAQPPCWGAMHGEKAVSEQALAEQAIQRLSQPAVVMGDRNFGIFSMAYAAQQAGHQLLFRLTELRARKLLGSTVKRAGEYPVEWKSSRWDRPKEQAWPAGASVQGRLIVHKISRGKKKICLHLFTDLPLTAQQTVELYARRWNIETDLRWLEKTIRLEHLTAKSVDMMEKELLAAVSAYNLVRAVMVLAARRANLHPRQLSFTYVLNIVDTAWPRLVAAKTADERAHALETVLQYAAQCKLPQRRKRRAYPRLVWPRGHKFPSPPAEKTK